MTAPATKPAAKANSVAIQGFHPATSRVAATDAPSVMDPSAVISGNEKMRKLK